MKFQKIYKTIPVESIIGVDESEILILNKGAIIDAHKYIKEIQYNKKKKPSKEFIDELKDYSEVFGITIKEF